jgi:hypothetical protein
VVDLSGVVFDATTNDPLPGVQINISGPVQESTTTGEDGRYAFDNLPAGEYWFEARKEGYDTISSLVNVVDDIPYNPLMRPSFSREDLADYYAPVWYQDVDSSDPDAEYITNFDFDNNWDGDDNWQHQNDGEYSLNAYIYYSVIETESHYFIMYADFHPRDWGEVGSALLECTSEYISLCAPAIGFFCHENDMEGALVAVRKKDGEPYGEFHLMATVFHTGFTFYPDSSDLPFDGTHPMLYVEPKGHGVQAYDVSHFVGDGAVKYVYEAGNAGVPSFQAGTIQTVKYDLIPIRETLWERRLDYRTPKDGQQTYKRWGLFDENEVPPPLVGARPPWGWGGVEALVPQIFINSLFQDPAHAIDKELDGLGVWSLDYNYNPYLAVQVLVSSLGGLLTSNDGSTEVRMPAGITTGSIKVIHTPLVDDGSGAYSDRIQAHPISQAAMSTSDLANVGHAFGLTAEFLETGAPVTSLLKPYEITFRYTDDEVENVYTDDEVENVFEDSLELYWWSGSDWITEPTSVLDEENNTVTATPEHLGNFAVLGIPKTTVYLPMELRNR